MTARLLLLGMIAGLIAGVLAFGTARVWGEPPIAAAIAIEKAGSAPEGAQVHDDAASSGGHEHPASGAAHTHSHGDGEGGGISRATQAGIGLFTGAAVYGTALGGLLALILAVVQGRVSHMPPRGTAAVIALLGFIAAVLVPQLKYPANPPAVGHGETIGVRTAMFFLMLAISVAGMVLAVLIARASSAHRWRSGLAGAAVYVAVVLAAGLLLPRIDEVPADFPGSVLWQFRTASLLVEAVLWAAAGLTLGWLVERRAGTVPAFA